MRSPPSLRTIEAIYDQGHLSPAADQEGSVTAQVNTFMMTNMAPQTCQFNRGIWQILEGLSRRWVNEHGVLYVLSGSVFDRDADRGRDPDDAAERMLSRNGRSRVAIPSAFYKIMAFRAPDGTINTLSIMMPHNTQNPRGAAARQYLEDHVVSIADIERTSGLDLFPDVSSIREGRQLWAFPGAVPNSLCMLPSGT